MNCIQISILKTSIHFLITDPRILSGDSLILTCNTEISQAGESFVPTFFHSSNSMYELGLKGKLVKMNWFRN